MQRLIITALRGSTWLLLSVTPRLIITAMASQRKPHNFHILPSLPSPQSCHILPILPCCHSPHILTTDNLPAEVGLWRLGKMGKQVSASWGLTFIAQSGIMQPCDPTSDNNVLYGITMAAFDITF